MDRMLHTTAVVALSGDIHWQVADAADWHPEATGPVKGVTVSFIFPQRLKKTEAMESVAAALEANKLAWLKPSTVMPDLWFVDLDGLKAPFGDFLSSVDWLKGRVKVAPDFDNEPREFFGETKNDTYVTFTITPADITSVMTLLEFEELKPALERFLRDHPIPQHCAFVMMRFGQTGLHERIFRAIEEVCARHGIKALRADGKTYAEELLPNVRTYMHGCAFGIAVFERLSKEEFNPNVSLEVGYMMAQGKPVCLLKDSTLTALQSDLTGRLYQSFDTQNPRRPFPQCLRNGSLTGR
jgi:nucleoside 2-deoxyribosyltransferase